MRNLSPARVEYEFAIAMLKVVSNTAGTYRSRDSQCGEQSPSPQRSCDLDPGSDLLQKQSSGKFHYTIANIEHRDNCAELVGSDAKLLSHPGSIGISSIATILDTVLLHDPILGAQRDAILDVRVMPGRQTRQGAGGS